MEGLRNVFGPCPRVGDQARPGGTLGVQGGGSSIILKVIIIIITISSGSSSSSKVEIASTSRCLRTVFRVCGRAPSVGVAPECPGR